MDDSTDLDIIAIAAGDLDTAIDLLDLGFTQTNDTTN